LGTELIGAQFCRRCLEIPRSNSQYSRTGGADAPSRRWAARSRSRPYSKSSIEFRHTTCCWPVRGHSSRGDELRILHVSRTSQGTDIAISPGIGVGRSQFMVEMTGQFFERRRVVVIACCLVIFTALGSRSEPQSVVD